MTRALYSLGRWCARHGRLVVVLWLLACLALVGANRAFGGSTADSYVIVGTDSSVAQDLLNRAFPGTAAEATPVVLHSDVVDFRTDAGTEIVDDVARALSDLDVVTAVTSPADDAGLLSEDGRTAIVSVTVTDRAATKATSGATVMTTARQAAPAAVEVELGGFLGGQLSRPDTRRSEVLGVLAALLVLLLTLRRVTATLIPVVNAMVSVAMGLAIVGLLGNLVFIPDVAPTLGTMLGLGVGIDYALFLVTRHRTLLRSGFDVADSVGRTSGTAGAGVVFAGCTLVAAVCGLVLTGLSFLAWLGYAAAIVVSVAVVASFTFVPALLGIMGHRVLPRSMREPVTAAELDSSRWARLSEWVTTRPWRVAIASTLVLLALAAPTLTLSLGHTDAGTLPPDTTARKAYDLTAAAFGPGATAPLAVVTRLYAVAEAPSSGSGSDTDRPAASGGGDPRAKDPRLVALRTALAGTSGVVSTAAPVVSTDGGVAIVRVTPAWGSADPATEALVHRLRDDVLPQATEGKGMAAHVGGVTAAVTDLSELIAARTPWFILGVVTLSFLLLMVAYRSLLIPLKAAVMNLLSIAAAYGVVTAVFQWGWGARLIGLDGPVPIESYVPMMMFAVLFGLSMDYEVFLLTAFREHWERTGDMVVSVRRGLADTGKVVTAAALIMVVVFASFILSTNPVVKMFGVGLSTAVAVDATIVRCLLVPAIMVLAARATWWLPRWLDVLLPQLHVEGDPAALDAIATARRATGRRRRAVRPTRPLVLVGAGVGAAVSWTLCSRVGVAVDVSLGVAVSALLGGVLSLVPRGVAMPLRAAGYAVGALVATTVAAVLAALSPPAAEGRGAIVAAGALVVTLAVPLVVGGAFGTAVVLGGVATCVVVALTAGSPFQAGNLLLVAVVPAVLAMLVAAGVAALGRDVGPVDTGAPEATEPEATVRHRTGPGAPASTPTDPHATVSDANGQEPAGPDAAGSDAAGPDAAGPDNAVTAARDVGGTR